MIKLVLADVDGTLLPFGQEHVSERCHRAVRLLAEAGVRFGLSTGRDVFELARIFEGDEALYANGILSNGKKIMVDGSCARLTLLDRDALIRLNGVVSAHPESFLCIYPLESDPTNPVYCIGATPDDMAVVRKRYAFAPIYVDEVPDIDIIAATISVTAPQEVTDSIKTKGADACPEFDFVQPAPHWTDVVPKGLNKGTALAWVEQEMGVSPDEVVVFGDSENDLAVLMRATHSVAVSNATPAVLAASRYHIGACEDEAVTDALEDIAQATSEGRLPRFFEA